MHENFNREKEPKDHQLLKRHAAQFRSVEELIYTAAEPEGNTPISYYVRKEDIFDAIHDTCSNICHKCRNCIVKKRSINSLG